MVGSLIDGLKALEYRGYDSAGVAVLTAGGVQCLRARGKVRELEALQRAGPLSGSSGIAHTRWATHGMPTVENAHPHRSGGICVVHNGIIENHAELRSELQALGYQFNSQTDSEVIAHLIEHCQRDGADLHASVRAACVRLHGSYALAVLSEKAPGTLVGARRGSPLLLGLGRREHYLASDVQALLPLTRRFVHLQDGDSVLLTAGTACVYDADGQPCVRAETRSEFGTDAVTKGDYAHYMLKEIHQQPQALAATLEARITTERILPGIFGPGSEELLAATRAVHIVACGTSLHAGMIARYWIEGLAGIPCSTDIASEYRYRAPPALVPGTLYVTITQSGETSDTLAALRFAGQRPYLARLAICNVPESSVVRESQLVLMTRAGPEIGVASTKAFTTQLAALALLALELARARRGASERLAAALQELHQLPRLVERALALEPAIRALSPRFATEHALFLGRGALFPLALEGALKLKEITYIHAEGFAAGELKHGPLALVDHAMPIVALVGHDHLIDKVLSNLEEARSRGGQVMVLADERVVLDLPSALVIRMPACDEIATPIVHAVALQLLAYHVANRLGTDIDQPRNLAKSVTVE